MPPIRTGDSEESSVAASSSLKTAKKYKLSCKEMQNVLGLKGEELSQILATIRIQTERLFDVSMTATQQPEEARQLDIALIKAYPLLFENEDSPNLKVARAYAWKRHGHLRHQYRRREVKVEEEDQSSVLLMSQNPSRSPTPSPSAGAANPVSIDLTGDHDMADAQDNAAPTLRGGQVSPSNSQPFESPASIPSPAQSASTPSSPVGSRMILASPTPSQTSTIVPLTPHLPHPPFAFGTTSQTPAVPSPSSALLGPRPPLTPATTTAAGGLTLVEHFSGSNIREVDGLRYFLGKFCKPSMGCFLDRFLEHGCHSLAYLEPLRDYPIEHIDGILRDMPKTNGRDMTPWEVILLRMAILKFPFNNEERPALPAYVKSA